METCKIPTNARMVLRDGKWCVDEAHTEYTEVPAEVLARLLWPLLERSTHDEKAV